MAETIRMLVATDNHVGAHERDPIRSDDSWRSFHEVMSLAKEHQVDMVLLAGDLFHDNVPSRKSMYKVMQSIRSTCLGPRPCELELLSDSSEHFDAIFPHVNYEDPDINVSIPIFSIHGNHDDPSGAGSYAALDILAVSGLVNYFGRASKADDIQVRPILIQKGSTKLALYGLSNVRDERLFRTFREGHVRFYQPGTQPKDWFQMLAVHQNHVPHTEKSYLPENFLPQFMDLIIWGHEHDCDMVPHLNPEMNFHVMQPGSSIATSLTPGEALPKHITILSVTGREFKSDPIRLKTVRPFIHRDVVLSTDKTAQKLGTKEGHRSKLKQYLMTIIEDMIAEGQRQWEELHPDEDDDDPELELNTEQKQYRARMRVPLVRLKVEITDPTGLSKFEVENPQRFSHHFQGRVANANDVIVFHQRKRGAPTAKQLHDAETEKAVMERVKEFESIKVEKLVKEFLEAQALTILPTNLFGESVSQFVDKDDRHAMEQFVTDALSNQIKELVRIQGEDDDETADPDEDELMARIETVREGIEAAFAKGQYKVKKRKDKVKPKPERWNSDFEGHWEDQPEAIYRSSGKASEEEQDDDDGTPASTSKTTRGRGRGRGGRAAPPTSTRALRGGRGRATKTTTASRSKKKVDESEEDEEEDDDDDVVMHDGGDSDSQAMFFESNTKTKTQSTAKSSGRSTKVTAGSSSRAAPAKNTPTRAAAAKGKQATLNFTNSQASVLGGNGARGRRGSARGSVSDDIEDEDDDFEEVRTSTRRKR